MELGSGIGLTGIITCRQCSMKSYTFTDLHKQVLEFLALNIQRNLTPSRTIIDGLRIASTVDIAEREGNFDLYHHDLYVVLNFDQLFSKERNFRLLKLQRN